jgi:hypothetical protein
MQVLTIVVQNTVPYHDLGVATSGVTFLRTLGSAFGVALFGAVYSNALTREFNQVGQLPPEVDPRALESPVGVHALPEPLRSMVVGGYSDALQTVFLVAVPIGLLATLVALTLRQVKLRDSVRAAASDIGEGLGQPDNEHNDELLERAVSGIWQRKGVAAAPGVLAGSGTRCDTSGAWVLSRVALFTEHRGQARIDDIARHYGLPPDVLWPAFQRCIDDRMVYEVDGEVALTSTGSAEYELIATAWRQWLAGELEDWDSASDEQFNAAVSRAARQLVVDEQAAMVP